MTRSGSILALDQGTTSSRAIVFGPDLAINGLAQREFAQHYPSSGWVEHDPEDLWRTTLATARAALAKAGRRQSCRCHGGRRDYQPRETTLVWDRRRVSRSPRHRLAGSPHRRICGTLKAKGLETLVTRARG